MTARDRLFSLRRAMMAVIAGRAALAAVTATLLANMSLQVIGATSAVCTTVAIVAGVVTFALFVRTLPAARSLSRVAMWVEEDEPALCYALVSIAGERSWPDALDAQARRTEWWTGARDRLLRALVMPALAAAAATLLLVSPLARHATATLREGAERVTGPRAVADPLHRLRITVQPPAYSGAPVVTREDQASVDALTGSIVTLSGEGDARRVSASLDSATRAVAAHGTQWTLTLAMPARPALVRLRSESGRVRLVALAPIADAPPLVTLRLPARDTVVASAHGALVVRAALHDDIGLRDAAVEIIVSAGQDERFTFRTSTLGRRSLANARDGQLELHIPLDSLALHAGDMLQLRVVAHDGNTVSGAGLGSSETRALRIAREGEHDSVAVDAAAPAEPGGQVISQRMLITLAEALEGRRRSLPRETMLGESRRIAADQHRLRRHVGDVVFQRMGAQPLGEEGDAEGAEGKLTAEGLLERARAATVGTSADVMDLAGEDAPILAVNRPLLEAYNAMWEAGRSLDQGEPSRALPPMRRALAAIERARQAERVYLRGRPGAVIVDVAHARLTGKEKGRSAMRASVPMTPPLDRARSERVARAMLIQRRDPSAAADSLLVLRVEALGDAPSLAAALDTASRTVRGAGDSATIASAWLRLRRAMSAAPVVRRAPLAWDGAP